ncbi:MAG: hypothetical protein AAF567_23320 [Actinomycetota bacterium]
MGERRCGAGDMSDDPSAGMTRDRVVANLTVLLQDGSLASADTGDLTEGIEVRSETFFDAGPASDRVVVVDVEPGASEPSPPVPFTPPRPGGVEGRYDAPRAAPGQPGFAAWLQAGTYGLVMRAIELFEYADVLARRIQWNFDAERLTVRPRADRTSNAAYRRERASLEFGAFDSKVDPGTTIYTALSRDIVAHETAHAVLDSIRPDLANGNPQSIALHEALADLTALHMALRSASLRDAVMRANDFRLTDSTPFNAIGEEMGLGRGVDGSLRNLAHAKTMKDVDRNDAHDLSEVLSGALWSMFRRAFDADVERAPGDLEQRAGRALGIGSKRFRRITLRALDYLPHGEAGFIDYGRALIASDRAAHPRHNRERRWLREEFVRRGIVGHADELESPIALATVADVGALIADGGAAAFFEARRSEFGVPAESVLEVLPVQRVEREFFPSGHTDRRVELILGCRWREKKTGLMIPGLPPVLEYTIGATVVIAEVTGDVLSALVSSAAQAEATAKLAAVTRLALTASPDVGHRLETVGGAVRVINGAAALHLT